VALDNCTTDKHSKIT